MSEVEPRRSVRATKGQHTKSFDELETANAPKRRQTKKSKKAQEQEQDNEQEETEPEEVIRCVCGATEQDDDSGEAWIMCDTCSVWQHNVCMGVSSFDDEIPDHYWCEQCRPHDHKELLDGIAKGEKPWEARRAAHEEEEQKKKKKGGRKGKGKRNSETKDELEKERARSRSKQPEAPAAQSAPSKGKRKSREESQDTDGKSSKLRRVSDGGSEPARVQYTAPKDLPSAISELAATRAGPAKALKKSIQTTLAALHKDGSVQVPEDSSVDAMSEQYAIQIERAVFDTHPGQKEYGQQIKSLNFNLKKNPELCQGLVEGSHSPNTLAVMTSDELASSEQQRQTAEMRAKAEKQSILYTQDTRPRVRRTHKGEEFIEDDSGIQGEAPPPLPGGGGGRRQVKREPGSNDPAVPPSRSPSQAEGEQHSPSNPNFDISKVFSSVKSPTVGIQRRPSAPTASHGPGVDADVDRMLEDENDSPPYSPSEEALDPDVVWRGSLAMSSIADFQANAKHVGGANFASIGPWSKLIPKRMTVAGRIPQQSAIEYLCSLRYSNLTDIIVVNLTPTSPTAAPDFKRLVDYFISKQRYGVVGDKVAGNVRDTYLVPVPPGDDNHPEFMLNLVDNSIPKSRTEPLLLAVFVYRNDPEQVKPAEAAISPSLAQAGMGTPTPAGSGQRTSISGPSFSPATPQAAFGAPPAFNGRVQSQTPVPIPQPPHARPNAPPSASPPAVVNHPAPPALPTHATEAEKYQAQQRGQAEAKEVLGPFISVPTVQFLLPQAFQMTRREWEVIKGIYERDPKARDDLQYLGQLLEKSSVENKA